MIVLIFCLVLFFYLHILFHLKTSNDLELYDIDRPSKEQLEEICDLRQPVMFQFNNNAFLETFTRETVDELYGAFDVNVRNVKDADRENEDIYKSTELKTAVILLENDVEEKIIIENNNEFLDETGLSKHYKHSDSFLRPFMVSECKYDFITGSTGSFTPLRYDLNYRNYYLVTEGSIRIKIAPPKSTKYMYSVEDYDHFEFRSPINCWNVQDQYAQEFNKVKCLDFTVNKGNVLFIPAYWWYSIRFECPKSTICTFKYKTFMNTLSILPKFLYRLLHQQHNIKNSLEKHMKRINCNNNNIEELKTGTDTEVPVIIENINKNDVNMNIKTK